MWNIEIKRASKSEALAELERAIHEEGFDTCCAMSAGAIVNAAIALAAAFDDAGGVLITATGITTPEGGARQYGVMVGVQPWAGEEERAHDDAAAIAPELRDDAASKFDKLKLSELPQENP